MSNNWTSKDYQHWQATHETPEDVAKFEAKREKRVRMDEKALQTQCEQWLHLRRYHRLTAKNATLNGNIGWFGHLHEAKRNPLMPDLFIFNEKKDKCLMVELKVRDKWRPGQREMVNRGAWYVAWSFQDFEMLVKCWEETL